MKKITEIVCSCLNLLTSTERKKLFYIAGAVSVMSFFELVGVAAILPFMSVAVNPNEVEVNKYLNWFFVHMGFTSRDSFLIFLGAGALCAVVFGNILRAYSNYLLLNFAQMQAHYLGLRVFRNFLSKPYEFHLTHNSSRLTNVVTSEIGQLVNGIFVPLLRAFGRFTTTIFLILMLVLIDFKVCVVMGLLLGGSYFCVYRFLKKKIAQLGKERGVMSLARFKSLNEASGGIKEVKLMGKESFFLNDFSYPSKRFAIGQTHNAVVGEIPKYILEAIAFGGIISLVIFLIASKGAEDAISLAALYAFAGYKMMPSLQEIFNSITKIKFTYPIVGIVQEALKTSSSPLEQKQADERVTFTNGIEIKNLCFKYSGSEKLILNNINTYISANTTVGIVGVTGSGKTTFVDLVLGLLKPASGEILIDGIILSDSNLRSWQNQIGYVPQSIYLADDTIESNIAFGITKDLIDFDKVRKAASLAQIDCFIESELPLKYKTVVGERGVRLSGGQRQRLGVARALYNDPSLIVFDEATSALDNETEKALMESIENLTGKKTILMIAHRLSTLEKVDQVIRINSGALTSADHL